MPNSSTPPVATDAQRALALSALVDLAPMDAVGPLVATHAEPDGITVLQFTCGLAGYPGWLWTVALATIDGDEPTVVEAELLPDQGALVAPEWVPWSVRLTEYLEAQRKAVEEGTLSETEVIEVIDDEDLLSADDDLVPIDDDDDEDDDDDDDEDDDDDDDDEDDDEDDDDDDDEDDEDDDDIDEHDLGPSDAHDHINEEDLADDNLHIVEDDESFETFDDSFDGDRRDI
jgi:hypothetical protein